MLPTTPIADLANPATEALAQAARRVDDLPCRHEPHLFFASHPDQVEAAKQLCATCPLQQLCLQAALESGEPWGVWGGELLERGQILAHKRPRGRPRKNSTAA